VPLPVFLHCASLGDRVGEDGCTHFAGEGERRGSPSVWASVGARALAQTREDSIPSPILLAFRSAKLKLMHWCLVISGYAPCSSVGWTRSLAST
jgi:hypothetical protein